MIPNWLNSGILNNTMQLAVEFHGVEDVPGREKVDLTNIKILNILHMSSFFFRCLRALSLASIIRALDSSPLTLIS